MPAALAMLATERSISAHRITKVRPTAMIPVTDTWVRMLPTLSSVGKDALSKEKKATRQMSVRKGAILRICPRSTEARRERAFPLSCVSGAVMREILEWGANCAGANLSPCGLGDSHISLGADP